MAVTVVLAHPHQHLLRRARWALSTGTGLLLVILAALVAPLAVFLVAAHAAELLGGGSAETDVFADVPYPRATITLVTAAAVAVTALGSTAGLRLLRGRRHPVLFLRHFRDPEAIVALTSAAAGRLGSAWRLVTLDDAEIAPVGVARGTRRAFGALRAGQRVLTLLAERVPQIGGVLLVAALAMVGLAYRQTGTFELMEAVELPAGDGPLWQQLPRPAQPLGADLATAFALTVMGLFVVVVAGLAIFMVVLVGGLLLFGPIVLTASAAGAAAAADRAGRISIVDRPGIDAAASRLSDVSRKVFAPRLVVLRVAHPLWRDAVRSLAAVTTASLVDVSEPTDNVLWEVEQLVRAPDRRCVPVGRYEDVLHLAGPAGTWQHSGRPGPAGAGDQGATSRTLRLLELLDGREVLAYTLTWRGRRRFARALRSALMCPDLGAEPARLPQR